MQVFKHVISLKTVYFFFRISTLYSLQNFVVGMPVFLCLHVTYTHCVRISTELFHLVDIFDAFANVTLFLFS